MTPTLVHRYAFPLRQAIAALVGDAYANGEQWSARVEGDTLVVDLIAPDPAVDTPQRVPAAPAEELKGGRRARQAAMACDEKGFRTFIKVPDASAARAEILRRCRVESRRMLDHNEAAGQRWDEIYSKYSIWLRGLDVSLD